MAGRTKTGMFSYSFDVSTMANQSFFYANSLKHLVRPIFKRGIDVFNYSMSSNTPFSTK